MHPSQALRIVVVGPESLVAERGDEDAHGAAERSRQLRIGLLSGGYNIVAVLPADAFLPARISQIQPDMIIIDAQSDSRDTLEHVVMVTRDERRAIVLFTEDADTSQVGEAIAAGVTAYVVAGLATDRIKPVLDVAMARFRHEQALRRELDDARTRLGERKLIERAKGLLMRRQNLGEDEAYARLRKTAMDRGLRVAEVAQRLIDIADVLA